MDFLRFLATRVSKTDKSISLATEVFKIQPIPPEPPLPYFISELIPIIDEKPKLWNADSIVQSYILNYESRSKLVSQLASFFGTSSPSLSQNEYMSIITLQSCCTLFFTPIESINPSDLFSFMKCLKNSIQYLPQNLTVFPDFFAVIFERLLNVDDTFNIYLTLKPLQIFANEYPEYTANCLSTHALVFSRIASSIISQYPSIDIDLISNQLNIITKAFDANKNPDKEICMSMRTVLLLLMGHLKNQKTISKIVYPIISLFVILKRETNCDIFQLDELMIFLIKNSHRLFEFTNSKTDFLIDLRLEPITFKFIDDKTFDKNVPADLENIKSFDSLLKYKDDPNYPLFHSSILLGKHLNNCQFDFTQQVLTDLFSNINVFYLYPYFAFLFLFIQQFTQYQEEICKCLTTLNIWEYIFGPIMFDPKIPINSNIIKLRQSLFESLGALAFNEKAGKIIRTNYCNFLKSIYKFPLLFSQVLEMSYPAFNPIYTLSIKDDLFNSIIFEMIKQQHFHLEGDKDAPYYRIPTMTVLNAILQNNNALSSVVSSNYFCSGILYFLYEEPCFFFFADIIDRVIQYFANNNKTGKIDSTALNDSFHSTFLYLIKNIKDERSMNIIHYVLNLFTRVVSFEPSFITPLLAISSSILSDLMTILVNLPKSFKSIRVMEIGLMLLSSLHNCSNFNYEAVPFSAIGESIERLGITKDFLLLIYQIIFSCWSKSKLTTSSTTDSSISICPTENSTTIAVPEALPLLLISVRNTDHYFEVLNRLIELCKESVCNCCSCLMVNVPTIVFENTKPNNEKEITLALRLFYEISKYVSNRQSLFSFFRLFSHFDRTKLNPLTLPCINTLEQICYNADKPSYCSIIQFSSENSIIRLPPLSVRDLQSGFVISSKLLLDSEQLSRFFFEFKNDNQNLSAFFTYGTLNFIVNDTQITPTFEMPMRKWFVLKIYFKSFQSCEIYIDDDFIETINFPSNIQFQDFKKCAMFHKNSTDFETLPLQVQYVTISAKSNAWNLSNLNIPGMSYSQPNEMKTFMNNSTNIFEFYADKVVPFDSGKNILTKIPSAHYTGLTIRFFTNFLKVFQACHSISFMITLTAMVAFQDPAIYPISQELLRKLSSLFTLLISKLPENTNNMLTRDSYSIISFFTAEASSSYFTKDIFDDFMTQLTIIPNEEQRKMLCQWIIFNYKVIGRVSIDTKIFIFDLWKTILEKWPALAGPHLTFQLLLYIFRTLVESKDNVQTILDIENQATGHINKIEDLKPKLIQARQIICSLLTSVVGKDLKDTDSDLLFYSVVSCSEDQPIIELLDCVKLFLVKFDLSNKFYATEHVNISIPWNYLTTVVSIKNTWASIYINLSEKVCCKFQSIYADTNYINHEDTNKYCQYLIARRPNNSNYIEDSSELSLVTNSCRLMLQIEENTSLESMMEMSSLFLQVPVFFVYAVVSCISSSEEMNDLFVKFFDKLCMNSANVTMLADKLTTYSLFYLMYWAVKRRPAALFSIATILSQKAQLAQNAINIIDSFSINCNFDLSQARSDLLSNIMLVISKRKPDQDIIQMGEVLALAILFRSHSTTNHQMEKAFRESPFNTETDDDNGTKNDQKEDKKESLPELEYLASLYIVEPDPDNPVMQTYSLYYDSDGKWVEVELTKKVIMFLSILWKSFDVDVHQSLCILISIMIQEVDSYEDLNGLQPIIEDLINEFKISDEFVNLVVGKIAHRGHVEAVKKLFWPILTKVLLEIDDIILTNNNASDVNDSNINSSNSNTTNINYDTKSNLLNILDLNKLKKRRNTYDNINPNMDLNINSSFIQNLFITGYLAMNNYCDQPPASLPGLTRELVTSFVSILEQFPKTPKPLSQEVNHHIKETITRITESINEKHHTAGRHWRQLWQLMTYERSPFFLNQSNMNSKVHLKRSSNFHKKFFTPILKRNTSFNKHIDASMKRDSNPDDSLTHLPRANSSAISSLPSHFNFFKDNSNDSFPEIVAVPNRYIWKARCDLIKITKTIEGSFLVSSSGFSFLDNESHLRIFIPAENVFLIFRQYYLQRPTAIEIFTTDNKSHFFNFPDVDSHKFLSYFKSILMPNAKFIQSYSPQVELARLDLTGKWVTRQISTFEYLMWINELSGRSMNNLNAYPIFPWVLNDYSSEKINLNDEKVFRDLSKPVGALNPTRLAKLKALIDAVPDINYLYQSTYSSSFMVLHLLVRLEPFTSVHIKYQDGKFDVASRVFTSVADCYQRCCNNNSNFRELIPEFFFCPEFLRNDDKFDLGVLPDGNKIGDVVLPPWAKSANEFIHIHKMALESDYVSTHIGKWIDLIWGCKQTGEEAIRSDNTFDPRLYPDCWEKINDPNDVEIVEDMLMKVGIIPQKIFNTPHPSRQPEPKPKQLLPQKMRAGSLSLLTYSRIDKSLFESKYKANDTNYNDTDNNNNSHEANLKIDATINTLSTSGNFLLNSRNAFAEIKVANSTIIDTKINGESIEKFKIFSLHSDGRIFICRTNSSVTPVSKDRIGEITIYTHSRSDSALFAFATENSSDLIIVKSNGSIAQKMSSSHIDAISCASFYREEVITGGKDSIVVKWSFNDKQELEDKQSLMAHAATVSCVSASDNFGIVVSCSIDGLLVASLISDFSFMMAIEMKIESNHPGFIPIKVLVTDMTGRIFVLCANSNSRSSSNILYVYTINGKFLNQISFEKSLSAWCQAPRSDGFDFIVFADSSNAIYLLDAFSVSIDRKVFQAPSKVTHLHYHNSIDLLAIGTESGSLYVGSLFY